MAKKYQHVGILIFRKLINEALLFFAFRHRLLIRLFAFGGDFLTMAVYS